MKITFVLPSYLRSPCGGFKVVYQLADRLAGRGHRVTLLHPRALDPATNSWASLKAGTWPWRTRLRQRPLLPWYRFASEVTLELVPDLRPRFFPAAEVVVATAWQTAARVAELPPSKGRQLLYAMDFEHWSMAGPAAQQEMATAFRRPFQRIACSPVVATMLESMDCPVAAVAVPAVAAAEFALDRPPAERAAGVFGFPLRTEEWKGARDAFAAFELLRARRPEIEVRAFGVLPAPELPPWVHYLRQPDDLALRRFYNEIATFLLPSRYEGWGLPALEAMACGAALVAARCGGVEAFARDGENALLVPPGRPAEMAAALERLYDDRRERLRLAEAGRVEAGRYSWEESVDVFEEQVKAELAA